MGNNTNPIINYFDNDTIIVNENNVLEVNNDIPVNVNNLKKYIDNNSIIFNTDNLLSVDLSNIIDNDTIVLNSDNLLSVDIANLNIPEYSQYINSPTSPINFEINSSVVGTLDSNGDLTIDGWCYVKGRNRYYYQNLTPSTTTSLTYVSFGSEPTLTAKFSGHFLITGIYRCSNNTVGDGVNIELMITNITTNTQLAAISEQYIQEGLASNEHTIYLYYELTDIAIGDEIGVLAVFKAINGGTASAKIVKFLVEEI